EDRHPRDGGDPPPTEDVVAPLGDHRAPAGRGRLNAEAQEADGRLEQEDAGELERAENDDGGHSVGKDVLDDGPDGRAAERVARLDELVTQDPQRLAAYQAGVLRPPRDPEEHDEDGQAVA